MDYRFRRDSSGSGTQENDSEHPPGMESCLKKLVLEAGAADFRSRGRRLGASGTVGEKKLSSEGSVGGKWVYTSGRRRAKKEILVK